MEKSENISTLCAALVKFQGETPVVKYDDKVKVKTTKGYEYSFQYASMVAIKETCRPILSKHGLAVMQLIGQHDITTIVLHETGEYISTTMNLPIRDNMTCQEIGSVITYMKRYAYSAVLNIASDEEDDGNMGAGNSVTKAPKKPTQPEPEPKPKSLPELKESTAPYLSAIQWVKVGGTDEQREKLADQITKKYTVSREVRQSILNAAKAMREAEKQKEHEAVSN